MASSGARRDRPDVVGLEYAGSVVLRVSGGRDSVKVEDAWLGAIM
jgi:hypothetical protein